MTPTQNEMLELAQNMAKFLNNYMGETGKEVSPMLHVNRRDGTRVAMPLHEIFCDELRDRKHLIIKKVLRELNAESYILACEVWTLAVENRDKVIDAANFEEIRPSQSPERISSLSITGENIFGDCLTALYRINEDGVRGLDMENPLIMHCGSMNDVDAAGGRMTNLLDVARVMN